VSNFNKKQLIRFAALLAVFVILSSLIAILRTPGLNLSRYPLAVLAWMRRETGGVIFYHRNLVRYETLHKEIDFLRQKIRELNDIYAENRRFKELLDFKQKTPYHVVACRVIGRSPDNWVSLVTVDKGSSQGIRRGFVVITYAGLVGRVTETTPSFSKITLINDPDFSVSALIQRSRQEGLVSGTLGTYLIMKYLPKDADVKVDDLILTSGLSSSFPKGLSIGKVIEIGEEFSGLSHYALIKPVVNLSAIEEVFVIIP
jgi:rod shape-determining protein MreC